MVNPAGQREPTFERIGDVGLNLLRWHSGIKGCDDDHRNVDGWKQIDRHAHQRHCANDRHHQADHDNEKWIPNRESTHQLSLPLLAATPSTFFGLIFSPSWNSLAFPITTRSPSFNPDVPSTRVLSSTPNLIFRCCTTFSALTAS